MSLSVAVMAHPKRAPFVEKLLCQLPDARVVWDVRGDRWDTGRRSMLAHEPEADWHVVIQDDAILCRDFLAGVEAVLAHVPQVPVSFYTGKCRPHGAAVANAVRDAKALGRPFVAMPGPLWGVAVALPVALIEAMVTNCDRWPGILNYDARMATHFAASRIECWHTVPSLVNHRVGPGNPSLVPGRGSSPARVAHNWIGDRSPFDIDWSGGALRPPDLHVPDNLEEDVNRVKLATSEPVIATEDRTVHDNALKIDRKVFAGQPIPPDLVDAYRRMDDVAPAPGTPPDSYKGLKQPALKGLLTERGVAFPSGPVSNAKLIELLEAADATIPVGA
jgi:hypothetical protein